MKRSLLYYTCLALLAVIHSTVFAAPDPHSLPAGDLQLIENKGQITDQRYNPRPDIDFKIAAGNGLNIFIGSGQIHYQWSKTENNAVSSLTPRHPDRSGGTSSLNEESSLNPHPSSLITYRMDATLLNANPSAEIITEDKQPFYEQYYTHLTGENGIRAYSYKKITYREVYPHIDWVFYINTAGQVEHDFVVRPGGKVSDIRLQYAGATGMRLNPDGSVTAATPFGSVTENAPYCFQQDGRTVPGRFVLANNTLSFSTAAYEGILTIDPVLEWGTYFGGSETDRAEDVATDPYGNVYITGRTNSLANIATTGAHQDTFAGGSQAGGAEAFLSKFNRDGRCLWSTYYGGERIDVGVGVVCDTTRHIYMAGYTNSGSGIATSGVHQPAKAGSATSYDAFLVKFDTAGRRIWGTYYGGTGADGNTSIGAACDEQGYIYLTGNTQSASGIASSNGYITTRPGGHDMFLARFKPDGTIDWSTYYGGAGNDYGVDAAVGTAGDVYVAGYTQSDNGIATAGTHQQHYGGVRDAFLVKFSPQGQLLWGTYYGGDNYDEAITVTCDHTGNVLMAGTNLSDTGIATTGSHQPAITEQTYGEGFCVKFTPDGQRIWGTYYGGDRVDGITAVTTGPDNRIYLAGETKSASGITTPDGYQPQMAGTTPEINSGFIIKMDSAGRRIWGTYYGGVDHDVITGIALDALYNLYIAGAAKSGSLITTPNSYQPAHGGGDNDAFLVRFSDCTPPAAPDTISGPGIVCTGQEAGYKASGSADADHYTWLLPAMWTGHSVSDSIRIRPSADGQIRVVAHSHCGGSSDTLSRHIAISPLPVLSPSGHNDLCAGDTLQLSAAPATASSYTWLQDGRSIPGAATDQYNAYASGSYRVITDNGICTDTSLPVTIVVHPLPVPVVVSNGGILSTTQPYLAYQWYYNGSLVTGATQATHTAAFDGAYAVSVTDSNNCRAMSAPVSVGDDTYVNDGISRKPNASVYPNPAANRLYISSPVSARLYIISSDGRILLQRQVKSGQTAIDISAWMPGIYMLRMADREGAVLLHRKITKL